VQNINKIRTSKTIFANSTIVQMLTTCAKVKYGQVPGCQAALTRFQLTTWKSLTASNIHKTHHVVINFSLLSHTFSSFTLVSPWTSHANRKHRVM